ncbi:hypothetical protein H312_01192 [Anncaliia algerae PRA339]|uniref:TAFII55 protein conserved region domain-containing protein n=1 Tax=Anncaliia algerae PRA339 TaxID=1288291 RepID=A0A059F1Z4_9MICR|nr:hypothetical protein H312_01192 [Anncaliia algerae PRA339]
MERQFILRLPDDLKEKIEKEIEEKGYPSAEIISEPGDKYFFKYHEKYPINVVKLPTFVESYKSYDDKQFCKIADISTLLVVNGTASELDGLTPPMKYVKERRFRKRKIIENVEDSIEAKVRALLEKDAMAIETKITWYNRDESEELEVKNVVEEIEKQLFEKTEPAKEFVAEESVKEVSKEEEKVKFEVKKESMESEIDRKISEIEESIKKASFNLILKKRYEQTLKSLKEEKERMKKEENMK